AGARGRDGDRAGCLARRIAGGAELNLARRGRRHAARFESAEVRGGAVHGARLPALVDDVLTGDVLDADGRRRLRLRRVDQGRAGGGVQVVRRQVGEAGVVGGVGEEVLGPFEQAPRGWLIVVPGVPVGTDPVDAHVVLARVLAVGGEGEQR